MAKLKTSFKFLLIILMLAMGFTSWLYTTEAGLQWLWSQSNQYLPKGLSIDQINGSLSSELTLKTIRWQNDSDDIEISDAQLNCDWISLVSNQLICKTIKITKVVRHQKNKPQNQNQQQNNQLTDINIPIDINVTNITIESFESFEFIESNLKQITTTNNSPTIVINQLNLEDLAIKKSKLSFLLLTADFIDNQLKIQIEASGKIELKDNWQHQLQLNIDSTDLAVKLTSQGTLKQQATFMLTSQKPYIATIKGRWSLQKGLLVSDAKLTAQQQNIVFNSNSVSLNRLNANIDLIWPELKVSTEIEFDWQEIKGLKTQSQMKIDDVTKWQENLYADLSINGELTHEFRSMLTSAVSEKNIDLPLQVNQASWPLSGKLIVALNKGLASLKSDSIQIGELSLGLKAKAKIDGASVTDLTFDGQLNAVSLTPILGFPAEGLSASWSIAQLENDWTINTQGTLANLQHPQLSVKAFDWNIRLAEAWSANIQAALIKQDVNQNTQQDSQQLLYKLAKLNMKGTAKDHHITASFLNHQNQRMKAELSAALFIQPQLNTLNDLPHYVIKKLKVDIPYQQTLFKIAATDIKLASDKQSVEKICIEGLGQACLSGYRQGQIWTVEAELKRLVLNSLLGFAQEWGITMPLSVEGQLNGSAKLSGDNDKLHSMRVDLLFPVLLIKEGPWQASWTALKASSVKSGGFYNLNFDWTGFVATMATPSSTSLLEAPVGVSSLQLTPELDFSFELEQKNLLWTPPYSSLDKPNKPFSLPLAQLKANLQSGRFNSNFKIAMLSSDHLEGNLAADWPLVDNSKIDGKIKWTLSQFDWLKQWQSQIDQLNASWDQQMTLSGTFNKPNIVGSGKVSIEKFVIEEIGLDIHDSTFVLSSQDELFKLVGQLKNKQGELHLDGQAVLLPTINAFINVKGENFVLLDNKENKVVVSPAITANWQNNHFDVKGSISVEEAFIKINKLPKNSVNVSEDQIIVNQEINNPINADSPTSYSVQLNLDVGSRVKIDSFGLKSGLKGQLALLAQTGKPIKLNGQLSLQSGEFTAYKQVLTIQEGQLFFVGAANNPGIQFKALRKIEDTLVGIIADGSLTNPRLTLYSEPPMAEENILALLLTGRSIESLSQKEGNALANAAIGLGVERANIIAQKLGAALGINNLSISSKTKLDSTRVDIGAKINDRLSVGYGTTIDSKNEMNAGWIIEYQLSKDFSFEAVSGEEVSASISYKKRINSLNDIKIKKEEISP